MSRYIPPTYKKARKEMSKNKTNRSKYLVMQRILDANWIKRNKQQPELILSALDEQMIFDCMEHYFHLCIQSDKDMIKNFCVYLEEHGYLDTDWYAEEVGIIEKFIEEKVKNRI
jgi:hypothetical protein